jgi:hypothetical protein
MQLRAWILTALLLAPANAHAGWFCWLYGNCHQQAIQAQASPVPALDFYGLAITGAALIGILRRKRK